MRVAIIGGTGFVGSYLVDALLENGHRPVLMVRPGSKQKVSRSIDCETVVGSVESPTDVQKLLRNCDGAIYLVGILREIRSEGVTFDALQFEGAARFIDSAVENGVKRLLLMSANGVKTPGTAYQESKYRADRHALASDIDATVFRPSVIFGDPQGRMEFATQLRNDMIAPPVPALGFFNALGRRRGHIRMSPVHITDVVDAFVNALDDPATAGQIITLAGPETLTWEQMLRRVASAISRTKWVLPMPLELMKLAARLLDWLPFFPVTHDQLTMLAESNSGGSEALRRLIEREPRAFDDAQLSYLKN